MCFGKSFILCMGESGQNIHERDLCQDRAPKNTQFMVFRKVPLLPSIKMEVRLLYPLLALPAALGEAGALYRVCVIFVQL